MLRIAMLSGWHVHAKGYARMVQRNPDAAISAVWDEEAERGGEWAKELGVPFEPCLDTLLARGDVDAVLVCAPTDMHEEVMVKAAKAKKAIFTEKVLALTLDSAERIAAAVREAGVPFSISFVHRVMSHNLFAKQVVEEGWLGRVTLARVRNAHDGASSDWLPDHFYDPVHCGGGAMMDLGAHPMYLLHWLLGAPKSIVSMFNALTGHAVEDNSVSVIEFKNMAIGVSETSFVSRHSPFELQLYGTAGSLLITLMPSGARVELRSDKLGAPLEGWISPQQLPKAEPSPLDQWIDAANAGTAAPFGLEDAIALTQLMEGAYASHTSGGKVFF